MACHTVLSNFASVIMYSSDRALMLQVQSEDSNTHLQAICICLMDNSVTPEQFVFVAYGRISISLTQGTSPVKISGTLIQAYLGVWPSYCYTISLEKRLNILSGVG